MFLVEKDPDGGFVAKALGESIITAADDLKSLHRQVRDAVRCHFDEHAAPHPPTFCTGRTRRRMTLPPDLTGAEHVRTRDQHHTATRTMIYYGAAQYRRHPVEILKRCAVCPSDQ